MILALAPALLSFTRGIESSLPRWAPGAARLEFGAAHATSFLVLHKGPGDEGFKQVADVLLPGVYEATGLAEGQHEFKIVPENSRGRGPESAVATIAVAVAAAA